MPTGDYNKTKDLVVDSVSGSPTVDKAQPIVIAGGDDSTTGNGDIILNFSNIAGPEDIAVYDQNGNLLDYEIESLDTTAETGVIWVYNSWTRDDTVQAQIAYGDNSANTDRQVTDVFSNETTNLQTYYFNESSGPPLDHSGNNFDGTNDGTPTTEIDGQYNGGFGYDGTGDQTEATTLGGFNSATDQFLAFNFWIKTTDTNNGWFVGKRDTGNAKNRIDIRPNHDASSNSQSTGLLSFRLDDSQENLILLGSTTSDTGITDGNWHMITYEFDYSGAMNIYVDAQNQSINYETQSSGTQDSWTVPMGLMAFELENGSNTGFFDGEMDQWEVYADTGSNALTSDEIQAKYDASPKAGQVYFSQQAADTNTPTLNTTTNTYIYTGENTSVVPLEIAGNVTVEGSETSGVEVLIYNKTDNAFEGRTTTDSNGDWSFEFAGEETDEFYVSYFYDDGSTYYASGETTNP